MVSTSWYDISQLWVSIPASNIPTREIHDIAGSSQSPGIYCVLFCICMHVLVHRPSSRGNTVLLVTAIALFTFSTILIVLILVIVTAEIEDLASIPSDSIQNAAYILYAINNSIADGLLIYRCYVVWNHNWRIIVVPVMLLIASTGCGLDIYLDPAPAICSHSSYQFSCNRSNRQVHLVATGSLETRS
ncbi:Cysteine proteinase [Mycena sanguinolenta]|uniref:Cysteine proteinase n=1 Tax=Mycena sanguinolenta TaxID=230812 RepID=A0A8H6X433_9AGAR|nr:Cysteine proteinase [Mycena sanguinolenta]